MSYYSYGNFEGFGAGPPGGGWTEVDSILVTAANQKQLAETGQIVDRPTCTDLKARLTPAASSGFSSPTGKWDSDLYILPVGWRLAFYEMNDEQGEQLIVAPDGKKWKASECTGGSVAPRLPFGMIIAGAAVVGLLYTFWKRK